MSERLAAAVDVGSNTVQLLIAAVSEGRIVRRDNHLRTTRLGALENGCLSERAIAATLAALGEFLALCRAAGCPPPRLVATSALRDALNSAVLLDAVKQAWGLDIEIAAGEREAYLSWLGANEDGRRLPVLDVGGSSTELAYVADGRLRCRSLDIGAVRAHSRLWDAARIAAAVASGLDGVGGFETLRGVGGTITCAAGLRLGLDAYRREAIDGYVLRAADIDELLALLLPLGVEQRCAYSPLLSARGEIIVEGLYIWRALIERLSIERLIISAGGILEGIVLDTPFVVY
ncbi:MAG: hypothetical protein Q4B96_06045 [Bacillota bacterium]|nr:hypothetical protein [Bacillota bacterium]